MGRPVECVIVLGLLAGCARSPRQRESRYMEQAQRLFEKKDYARAALQFRNAIQAMPGDAEPYYRLGLTYLAEGNRRQAAGCFLRATELNPRHAGAQLKLASLLASGNNGQMLADAQKRAQGVAEAMPDNVDALNTLAMTELRLGRPEEAAAHLEQALERLPGDLTAAALLMRARLAQGDARGAEEALRECLRRDPQSAVAALAMGRFYLVTHRPEEAERQFRRALQIRPQWGAALLDLGMTLFHTGRREEAGPIFQQAAGLADANYRPAYAIYLLETGRREAALAELERLAALDPADRAARTRLVKMYAAAGRRADAEKVLARTLAANPKDVDARLQRAEMDIDAQKYTEARNDLNLVLRYRPEAAEPHVILARLARAQGQSLNQRQELAEAVRLNPAMPGPRLELAELLRSTRAAGAALETLDGAPETQKRAVPYIVERNWALIDLGRRDEARRGVAEGLRMARTTDLLLQDAWLRADARDYAGARASIDAVLRQSPEELRAVESLVRLDDLRGRHGEGVAAVRQYAARRPESAPLRNYLGELLLADGDAGGARRAFTAALEADAHSRPAQLALARLDVAEGRLDEAHRSLAALEAGNPNDREVWLYLGWLASVEKDGAQAVAWFRKVVAADPGNVVALNNLAYLLAAQNGPFDEALQYAQQVKELAPDNRGVDDTIGWILYRKGLYSSAVKYLESAMQGATDPVVGYHLGMAYLKTGDRRGEATLRAALKGAPHLPEAQLAARMLEERSR